MTQLPRIPDRKSWLHQFAITRASGAPADLEPVAAVGDWLLSGGSGLRTQPVTDRGGRQIGVLIGAVIDVAAGKVHEGGLVVDWPGGLDATLYGLGGSWACLIAADGKERIYLDADGTLSLVYDPETRAAASTAGLLLSDWAYRSRFDANLFAALDVPGEGWFPSGLTAHKGVRRLLCNHYLDLGTFKTVRHWPAKPFTHAGDAMASAYRVADIVRRQAEAMLAEGKVAVALTGGNETRFLMAAYRPIIKELTFVTVDAPSTQRDVVLAKRLAEQFGLRHRLLLAAQASEAEQDTWLYATGHTVTGPNMITHPTVRPLADEFAWFLGGLGGEIGRAFFWRATDTPQTPMAAEDLVPRFGMPIAPQVVDATREWLRTVEDFDSLTKLDLAYLELRMSAWSGAQTYAQSFVEHHHPLIHREIYGLMLDLPPAAKRENLLLRTAIAELWPELGTIPINRYGDYRDTIHLLAKAANHKRVMKKLRKVFG